MRRRNSALVPAWATIITVTALLIGYQYADLTHHRAAKPPGPPDLTFPGTNNMIGILTGYDQRVMSLRTAQGPFAVILAQTAVVLPTCGHYPTWRAGEALELRLPTQGNGVLIAQMVRPAGPCSSG